MKWILDTNIWIYLFQGRKEIGSVKEEISQGTITPVLVPVVFAEVLGWNEIPAEQEIRIRDYFSTLEMLPITMDHWEQVISWRQKGIKRKLPNLLIGALSKANDIPVFTRNVDDFSRLGISFENPWERQKRYAQLF